MSKTGFVPLKMVVENGRLAPATAYDQERLSTWARGTKVNVTFVRDGGRVMERKWFAILNRAVKECKTPWKTAAEASEAIKLAIGVVNLTKTVGGDFLAYPKSLTELDDPELDDAVQQMIDVVHHITGVDPEEWKKQVAHIRDEEQTATETGSGDRTADPDETGAEQTEAGNGSAASSAPVDPSIKLLMEECVENLLRDAFSEPKDQQAAKVEKLRDVFLEPQNLGGHPKFVELCAETVRRIIGKQDERARAKEYLLGRIPE